MALPGGRSAVALFSLLPALAGAYACSTTEDRTFGPPIDQQASPSSSGTGGLGLKNDAGGPPPPDAGGLCGNDFHQIITDPPNIYFVLDTSGSMATIDPTNNGKARYELLRGAVIDLVKKLGPLINVGAALFPLNPTDADPCAVGGEVMSMRAGDVVNGTDGPTTKAIESATLVSPLGGTPTAATLAALLPKLKALTGRTIVVLTTDGGPNCNLNAMCDVAHCIPNIEGDCSPQVNCCLPGMFWGPSNCLDDTATIKAVGDIASANIQVYVVGISGSEAYEDTLGQMALAGGAAQIAPPYYYQVKDVSAVESTLGAIASLVVSCDFDLTDPPDKPGMTNVYLDGMVLDFDPKNGWDWKTPSTVELRGAACGRLKNGMVKTVQIVSGCPTEMPK